MTRRPRPPASRLPSDPLDWIPPIEAAPGNTPIPDFPNERNDAMTELSPIAPSQDWLQTPLQQALDVLSNPVMVAGRDHVIRFVNEAAYRMFEAIEADIQRDLPDFRARSVVGKSVDVFHKNPAYQHRILDNLTSPHDGKFTVGGRHLAFRASPIMGKDGAVEWLYVEWQDRSAVIEDKIQIERLLAGITEMTSAHEQGWIHHVIPTDGFNSEMKVLAESVNTMVENHIATKRKIIDCVSQFALGNFDAQLETFANDRAFVNVAVDSIRANFRKVNAEIARLAGAIVNGQLDVETDPEQFSGSFRTMVETFERVFKSLNSAFQRISEQVEQVSITVAQMSQSSQSLATNSQIQSSSVDQVSASAEETDTQVKANAAAAGSASQLVTSASGVASDGREKINQMVTAMEGIRVSSQDIAKIIKVIDEIAFQTNLLALNAAVEAARAGQHGRGFAVVAQEVRNLAGRSAKAARETSDYIEDATVRVREGVRIADETSKSFGLIADDIEKVRLLVGEIATASEEQSRGVAQINSAIGEVAKSALSTSQQADELAASAAEMQAATENMRSEVGRFKLRKVEPLSMPAHGFDQISPDLLAQIQKMVAAQMGVVAPSPVQLPVRLNGLGHPSADHDERGFAGF